MRVSAQSKKDFEKTEKSTFLLIFRAIFSITGVDFRVKLIDPNKYKSIITYNDVDMNTCVPIRLLPSTKG